MHAYLSYLTNSHYSSFFNDITTFLLIAFTHITDVILTSDAIIIYLLIYSHTQIIKTTYTAYYLKTTNHIQSSYNHLN